MSQDSQLDQVLQGLSSQFRCPGGAVAVVQNGQLSGAHVWGYASLEQRIPITPQTIFPICSISKQMVCLVLTDLLMNDKDQKLEHALQRALKELLPDNVVSNTDLTVERLVAMQSGLRDYWALSVLWGALPGGRFSIYSDAPKALKRLGAFHFPPGTQMSYCNTNFLAVGSAIEKATGQTLGELLEERVFKPAGMVSAALRADTERIPAPIVGYEGNEETGYISYQNRIEWAGDAGIQASLEDMIAYEKYIDRASTTDKQGAYSRNAQEPRYKDGYTAYYGFGLMHDDVDGIKTVGHSGALAGFRLFRTYAPEKRTSVVVLLNHNGDSRGVGNHVLKQMFQTESTKRDCKNEPMAAPGATWTRYYLDEEANIAITTKLERPDELVFDYAGHPEKLKWSSNTHAASSETDVTIEHGGITVQRLQENRCFTARPIATLQLSQITEGTSKYTGSYHSEEIDSTFHVSGHDWLLYGAFDGYLGKGPAHVMRHIGEHVWLLSCRRSLDAPAPGDWTVMFRCDKDGLIEGVTVSCWLARKIRYTKTS